MTEQKKTYRVAIIEGEQYYEDGQYESITRFLCNHITDWTEVTEEEYAALKWYCAQQYGKLRLIIHHDHEPILAKSMAGYIKWAEEEKQRADKREAERLKRAATEAQRTATRKKKRIEKLAAEAGLRVVPNT